MFTKVGPKGQIVIPKEVRDRLGITPGWLAVTAVVDDHIEVHFFPPEHRMSLKGSLAEYARAHVGTGEEWDLAREAAWAAAAREKLETPEQVP